MKLRPETKFNAIDKILQGLQATVEPHIRQPR